MSSRRHDSGGQTGSTAGQLLDRFFTRELPRYLPHLSVDCVVFGFHDAELKVLLLKWTNVDIWALPGGYVGRRQSLDAAAERAVRQRTGLRQVHLRQFHAFGGLDRREAGYWRRWLAALRLPGRPPVPDSAWPLNRVVSIGYYGLVDFSKVRASCDVFSDACAWFPIGDQPPLAFDHGAIISRALDTLRANLDSATVGATLLPERFTMPELQRLHEAILGRALDRRNFQKRMLDYGILERTADRRAGGAHRAPYLYRFRTQDPSPSL